MALKDLLKKYDYYLGPDVPQIERLPSGIFAFDLVTGGGIPLGRFTEFFGDKSTGKSTLSLRLINQFLNRFPDQVALYMDFEQTYDSEWASHFISEENMKRVYVSQPDYGELGIDFLSIACKEQEVGLVVIDSLAMIIPTKEADSEAGDSHIGLLARLVNSMFRKLLPTISQSKKQGKLLTFILLNQIRVKISGRPGFGTPVSKPAGKMQDAIISMDIRFYTKEYKKKNDLPVKVVHSFTIEKNKVGGQPKRSGEYALVLVPHDGFEIGDTDDRLVIISYAKKTGVLVREGNKWSLGKHTFKNLAEVAEYLSDRKIKEKLAEFLVKKISKNPEVLLDA